MQPLVARGAVHKHQVSGCHVHLRARDALACLQLRASGLVHTSTTAGLAGCVNSSTADDPSAAMHTPSRNRSRSTCALMPSPHAYRLATTQLNTGCRCLTCARVAVGSVRVRGA